MSLIKQLWLAVLFIMVLAFGASFIISTATGKLYLEQQLEMKNTDNAVSLALSISQMEKDPVAVNLMISAQFDNGHYEYIRLVDPNQQLITERVSTEVDNTVPNWFKALVHIAPNPGIAQIQDGWTQYGVLTLASATQFAYADLWDGTRSMLLWSTVIALICGVVGTLLLKMIVRPLDEMVALTEAIADKKFISIKEPSTYEFQSLARALNILSQKIKEMFKNESDLLEQMRLEANYDEITGLMNRKYFSNRVSSYIANNDNFTEGVLVVSHINILAEINEALGSVATDGILKRMGLALQAHCKQHPDLIAGRLTGADFAIFSNKQVDHQALCGQIEHLLNDAAGLQEQFDHFKLRTIASTVRKYEQLQGLKALISTIKTKTHASETDIMNWVHQEDVTVYEDQDETQWRQMLTDAIEAKRLQLASFPVASHTGEVMHYESPAKLQLVEKGPWLAAGEFIAWANQLNLAGKLDILVLEKAVEALATENTRAIAINVSTHAMLDENYHQHLRTLIKEQPTVANRLWLEVAEDSVFKHLPQFIQFCEIAQPLGCKLGVEHIGTHISRLGELHELNLDYIKISASIIRNIDQNHGNKAFLKGICLIAHSIGLITIAEGVNSEKELSILPELGIDAATGPAVK